VVFFSDQLNAHQCSYVTRADRRVEGLVAEWVADSWRIHGGFMADSWRIHGGFMAEWGRNGFAKVDNGFGYEKWLQGGSIGFD